MQRLSVILLFFAILVQVSGQDTITLMHYNLLNYGNTTTYCTQSNNNITEKAAAMAVTCTYVRPDLLTVNEMGANSFASNHFLNNVLNINGVNYYQASALTNTSSSDLANFLFYDARNFVLHSQHQIATSVRDINLYRLYHNDSNLSVHHDTAIFYIICTHLKAGNSSSDAAERAVQAKLIIDSSVIWDGYPAILTGDFNLYKASEQAWINLTAPADTAGERFYDPIDSPGNWQDNSLFASIHTQSTRATSNGCASGGGLDDRFDFILINKKLKHNPSFYQYMDGSYKVPGNDGNHLNQSINTGTNTSAPSLIIQALFDASDHLPVVMKLLLQPSTQGVKNRVDENSWLNRVIYQHGHFRLSFRLPVSLKQVMVFDLTGKTVVIHEPEDGVATTFYALSADRSLPAGLYILKAIDQHGHVWAAKVPVH